MKVTLNAPAKINLYLDVLGRRENGYHDIESIMQTVTLFDTVTVERSDELSMTCSDASLPCDEKNLCIKAARRFFERTGITGGARIHVEKRIPVSSGLAGGSTDAAATLKALDEIYGHPMTEDELYALGATLGADVPFCMKGGCVLCRGIGEEMTEISYNCDYSVVIARAGEGVSTPKAYGALDEKYGDGLVKPFGNVEKIISALDGGDSAAVAEEMLNTFEAVVLPYHKEAREAVEYLKSADSLGAMMSGSGPAVFALFDSDVKAQSAADSLTEKGYRAFAVRPTP